MPRGVYKKSEEHKRKLSEKTQIPRRRQVDHLSH